MLLLAEAVDDLLGAWPAAASDATVARVSAVLERFIGWCASHDVLGVEQVTPAVVAGFVSSPLPAGSDPWPATMDGRRAAVRLLFRHLRAAGLASGDPTLDVQVPGRVRRSARPLTDEEVLLGRQTAQLRSAAGGGYAEVGWALAESGAVTSEIAQVRVCDLLLEAGAGWVTLNGSRRHDARTVELTAWASSVMRRRVDDLAQVRRDGEALVAYRGTAAAGTPASQSAICTSIRAVLLHAGLAAVDDQVRPASIRHWAGRCRYDAGWPLERVARWLGMRSLDAAAYDLDLAWADAPAGDRIVPAIRRRSRSAVADGSDAGSGAAGVSSDGAAGGDY